MCKDALFGYFKQSANKSSPRMQSKSYNAPPMQWMACSKIMEIAPNLLVRDASGNKTFIPKDFVFYKICLCCTTVLKILQVSKGLYKSHFVQEKLILLSV